MNRLTSDRTIGEMTNFELAFNCCISEEGRAVYRDFGSSTDARELTRKLLDAYGVECFCIETDEDFDELMLECLMDGMFTPSGLIAIVYRFIWAMAEMRSRLKRYEDTGLDPEQLYEMDKIFTEKCKELMELKSREKRERKPLLEPFREEEQMEIIIGGLYYHFKGGLYRVIGIAEHSESLEKYVVYQNTGSEHIWIRPITMWNDIVDGKKRFEFICLEGEEKKWQE